MTIIEGMKKYRLPNPSAQEDLECRWSKVLNFGDKVLVAGRYYTGEKNYYAVIYEYLTDDHTCEGLIGIREVSDVEFEDDGHAIAWAIRNA